MGQVELLVGIDEAGRGPLAGPVVAAAVGWLEHPDIILKDSKQVSPRERKKIFEFLMGSVCWSIGTASAAEIDRINIRQATLLAMERAVAVFPGPITRIIIDGLDVPMALREKGQALVKADQLIPEVSAASIIAKVFRDELMVFWSHAYSGYGFEKHKGYPTAFHKAQVRELHLSQIHRRTFCKWL